MKFSSFLFLIAAATFSISTAHAEDTNADFEAQGLINIPMPDNTHLMDANSATGFAIYRTSKPNKVADFKRLCAAGVTEIMVLDGTGSIDAGLAKKYCPAMKVIYNKSQSAKTPVGVKFLKQFDDWVQYAQTNGVKIAFRCSCGCHRTGRLAAYYNMKYKGFTAGQAVADMYDHGRFMFLYGFLKGQVYGLRDYLDLKICKRGSKSCVIGANTEIREGTSGEAITSL